MNISKILLHPEYNIHGFNDKKRHKSALDPIEKKNKLKSLIDYGAAFKNTKFRS